MSKDVLEALGVSGEDLCDYGCVYTFKVVKGKLCKQAKDAAEMLTTSPSSVF